MIDETVIPKPPPPLIEVFNFKTLTMDRREKITQESAKSVRFYREYINDNVWLEMVEIPGGEFLMGTPEGETDRNGQTKEERPVHKVAIKKFWIGQFEVTQEQWRAVAELPKVKINLEDQSAFKGDKNLPAERITWDEAVEFCARLAAATGREYRLPTEAEWEYAARAATTTAFAFGETINVGIVNYDGSQPFWPFQIKAEGRRKTVAVGSLGKANAFGLFDMHGNVVEWCQDRWHPNYDGAPADGSAWMSGNAGPVIRGGSYEDAAPDCRSARRVTYGTAQVRRKDQGFRVAVGKPF
ncbi:MAG TPA: formylglycine-generating enzyme family protein [Blastocatellia bacterium]|nr:formylglycine-generating enzyme family protein [Blastocatellia bacterium]HMY70224.1 formylglycine-generating enzyme family protein [Blastocatellia bacterium]HNG30493.1 formylglycine-generating enzyme family protein [Blastocatellia bacterium]